MSYFMRFLTRNATSRHARPAEPPQRPHAAPVAPTDLYAGPLFPPSVLDGLWQHVETLRYGARDDERQANQLLGLAARKYDEADALASLLRRAEHEAQAETLDGLEAGLRGLLPPVVPLRHYTPSGNGFRPVCGAVASEVYTAAGDVDCPACLPLIPEWARPATDPTATTLTMHTVPAEVAR